MRADQPINAKRGGGRKLRQSEPSFIRERREALGIPNLGQLGERCGFAQSVIYSVIKGLQSGNLPLSSLLRLAEGLEVSLDELVAKAGPHLKIVKEE